jgi:glycosyltransferase involved in cell wall biosynthesis
MCVSIVIPTFNGGARIKGCLDALVEQTAGKNAEIIVVDDGSNDNTADVVACYSGVRLVRQSNAGPAAARNRGAIESHGAIVLFTDDDCVPAAGWVAAMTAAFKDANVVGVKGVYRTRQTRLMARFVQLEYEDKYRLMSHLSQIDFIDTYSAGFRRDRFLEMNGYDTSFPVACAEDVELSYRMSRRGWTMTFVPTAMVYHTHPETLWAYLKKKYKFAFWRVLAVRKNPQKGLRDSHTPQVMKVQLLLAPLLVLAIVCDFITRAKKYTVLVCVAFLLSTIPFTWRTVRKDPIAGLLSPALLAARACAQLLGVMGGLIHAFRRPANRATESHA